MPYRMNYWPGFGIRTIRDAFQLCRNSALTIEMLSLVFDDEEVKKCEPPMNNHPYGFNSANKSGFWTKEVIDKYMIHKSYSDDLKDYDQVIQKTCKEQIELWREINELQEEVDNYLFKRDVYLEKKYHLASLREKVKLVEEETGRRLIQIFNNNKTIEAIKDSIDLHGTNQTQCRKILKQVLQNLMSTSVEHVFHIVVGRGSHNPKNTAVLKYLVPQLLKEMQLNFY